MKSTQPKVEWRRTRQPKTECPRGHALKGYNAKPYTGRRHATPQCRTCHGANQWAKKQNLFNDDPRTLAYAAELYARYQARDAEQR